MQSKSHLNKSQPDELKNDQAHSDESDIEPIQKSKLSLFSQNAFQDNDTLHVPIRKDIDLVLNNNKETSSKPYFEEACNAIKNDIQQLIQNRNQLQKKFREMLTRRIQTFLTQEEIKVVNEISSEIEGMKDFDKNDTFYEVYFRVHFPQAYAYEDTNVYRYLDKVLFFLCEQITTETTETTIDLIPILLDFQANIFYPNLFSGTQGVGSLDFKLDETALGYYIKNMPNLNNGISSKAWIYPIREINVMLTTKLDQRKRAEKETDHSDEFNEESIQAFYRLLKDAMQLVLQQKNTNCSILAELIDISTTTMKVFIEHGEEDLAREHNEFIVELQKKEEAAIIEWQKKDKKSIKINPYRSSIYTLLFENTCSDFQNTKEEFFQKKYQELNFLLEISKEYPPLVCDIKNIKEKKLSSLQYLCKYIPREKGLKEEWKKLYKKIIALPLNKANQNKMINKSTAFHLACMNPNIDADIMKLLLEEGASYATLYGKQTPLHLLANQKNNQIMKECLSALCDFIKKNTKQNQALKNLINAVSETGEIVLSLLIQKINPVADVVKTLLDNGANINMRINIKAYPKDKTCLDLAFSVYLKTKSQGHLDIIKLLLDQKKNQQDSEFELNTFKEKINKNTKVITQPIVTELLNAMIADKKNKKAEKIKPQTKIVTQIQPLTTQLAQAIKNKNQDTVDSCLKQLSTENINKIDESSKQTALQLICNSSYLSLDRIKILIDKGSDCLVRDKTQAYAFYLLCNNTLLNDEILRFFAEKFKNVFSCLEETQKNNQAIYPFYAYLQNDKKTLNGLFLFIKILLNLDKNQAKLMLKNNITGNFSAKTTLHYILKSKIKLPREELLIQSFKLLDKEDLNVIDVEGKSYLHILCEHAVHKKNLKAIKTLINLGADAAIVDKKGNTALHYYIENNSHFKLLKPAALFNAKTKDGKSILSMKNKDGNTPVHLALLNSNATKTLIYLLVKDFNIIFDKNDSQQSIFSLLLARKDIEFHKMKDRNGVLLTDFLIKKNTKNYASILLDRIKNTEKNQVIQEDDEKLKNDKKLIQVTPQQFLFSACKNPEPNFDLIQYLITEYGAKMEEKNDHKKTPLDYFLKNNQDKQPIRIKPLFSFRKESLNEDLYYFGAMHNNIDDKPVFNSNILSLLKFFIAKKIPFFIRGSALRALIKYYGNQAYALNELNIHDLDLLIDPASNLSGDLISELNEFFKLNLLPFEMGEKILSNKNGFLTFFEIKATDKELKIDVKADLSKDLFDYNQNSFYASVREISNNNPQIFLFASHPEAVKELYKNIFALDNPKSYLINGKNIKRMFKPIDQGFKSQINENYLTTGNQALLALHEQNEHLELFKIIEYVFYTKKSSPCFDYLMDTKIKNKDNQEISLIDILLPRFTALTVKRPDSLIFIRELLLQVSLNKQHVIHQLSKGEFFSIFLSPFFKSEFQNSINNESFAPLLTHFSEGIKKKILERFDKKTLENAYYLEYRGEFVSDKEPKRTVKNPSTFFASSQKTNTNNSIPPKKNPPKKEIPIKVVSNDNFFDVQPHKKDNKTNNNKKKRTPVKNN